VTAALRLLFGRERFSAELAWQDLGPLLPGWEIVVSPPRRVADYLGGVDAMCSFGALIDATVLEAGVFGIVHQCGVGLERVNVARATVGMPGAWGTQEGTRTASRSSPSCSCLPWSGGSTR
jgi:hypothetical protein